ncbi:hypothetical protein CWE04_01130 [Thomasclavelia cocleata]|uniref:Helix-turn-helix domain-containing protein n=2 Tax=Thomasclavelia cocleata TaxID=69824 RepID=A0A1I0HP73_9FIRM|nr:response regulator [Thomasclavelia cocleata]MCR1960575.1 response regulator [Thomasclavelia cocleata]NDO41540.1 response regulator [Thomasclavelia cocleata]PJN81746.1 hypothetical protein CWE04_01130 [Thomasclavelia cocleata]SET84968.1 Helix-turn-helix domain-containing protein [Thomasclavelia cocleata]
MYKILVVEDEEIERKALVSLLKEHFAESLVVYNASNGMEALEILKDEDVQIIVSDINLPGINGLETIEFAKKMNKDIISLVLTSYSYFEYAKEAIKLGVEDFILKPVSIEKMCNTIYQIINKIDSRNSEKNQATQLVLKMEEIKPIVESDCIHSIVQNSRYEEIRKYFSLLNIAPKSGFCIVFQEDSFQKHRVHLFITEMGDLGCRCMIDSYFEVHVLFVFSFVRLSKQDIAIFEAMIKKYFDGLDQIGVGTICMNYKSFYDSYVNAIRNVGHPIKLKENSNLDNQLNDYLHDMKKLCQNLIKDFLKFDTLNMQRRINLFYLEILYLDRETLLKIIYDFNQTLIILFNQEFNSSIDLQDKEYLIELNSDNPYRDLLDKINDFVNSLVRFIENANIKSSNVLVKKALAYISLNYKSPITLNSVASYLGVTPFYISNLLSTHTSKNFTDLVTEYRVEKAKEMLKENYQIKEIASKLGFGSHNYFSKVFKKVTGLTPKEYKSKFD